MTSSHLDLPREFGCSQRVSSAQLAFQPRWIIEADCYAVVGKQVLLWLATQSFNHDAAGCLGGGERFAWLTPHLGDSRPESEGKQAEPNSQVVHVLGHCLHEANEERAF